MLLRVTENGFPSCFPLLVSLREYFGEMFLALTYDFLLLCYQNTTSSETGESCCLHAKKEFAGEEMSLEMKLGLKFLSLVLTQQQKTRYQCQNPASNSTYNYICPKPAGLICHTLITDCLD